MDTLLAIGLLLSSASQLRPSSVSIGPGEALLGLWACLSIAREVLRLGPPFTPPLIRIVAFWSSFVVALCVGAISGYVIGDLHDPKWFAHDVVSYIVVSTISCLLIMQPDASIRMRHAAWLLSNFGVIFLVAQLGMVFGIVSIPTIDPWEWDRFRGLTDNANQLALVCLLLTLLSAYLIETSTGLRRQAALLCLVMSIVIGLLSKSDAFALALASSGLALLALKARRAWLSGDSDRRFSVACLVAAIAPVALALILVANATGANPIREAIKAASRGGDTDATAKTSELRLEIWSDALTRGINAGALGLGPGPHLEIPTSIVADRRASVNDPNHVVHPNEGIAPNFEAHNTLLDLFLQGGFIAVVAVAWLFASTSLRLVRGRNEVLAVLLVGLATFMMFHLDVRHPIVWFSIALCLVIAEPDSAPRANGSHKRMTRANYIAEGPHLA